jgi:hypothetical protein
MKTNAGNRFLSARAFVGSFLALTLWCVSVVEAAVPDAPTSPIALPSSGKVFVSWTAPFVDEGLAITSYTVTGSPGGATCSWTNGPLTCAVTGLSNGQPYTFTVTAANGDGTGPASSPTTVVTPGPSPIISYASASYTFPMGIEVNVPKINAGISANRWTITPNLTANTGLLFNPFTGRILGTPVYVSPATLYTVTAVDSLSGMTDRTTVTIAVTPTAPAIAYATPQTYTVGSEISTLAPNSTGGRVASWLITPNLSANTGLVFNTTTGKIFGTPSYGSPSTAYTVTATGFGGTQGTAIITIATTAPAPTLTVPEGPFSFPVGSAIAPIVKSGATGIIHGYAITPNLTAATGLLFNPSTARIEGTPALASAPTDYKVIATGPGGSDTAVVSIATTSPAPTLSYPDAPLVYPLGSAITPLVKTSATGIIHGYTIAPSLTTNTGLSFNPSTGRIEGTPVYGSAATDYVITAMGPGGTAKDTVNISTTSPAPTLSYANTPLVYAVGSAITPLVKSSATGFINGYSIAPNVTTTTGLLFSATTGRIEGTPSLVSGATDYVITATGPGGMAKDTVNITTTATLPTVTYPAGPFRFFKDKAITTVTKSASTGIITSYTITPSLAVNTGLQFNATSGRILGTPTKLSDTVVYSIRAVGPGGTSAAATVQISVVTATGLPGPIEKTGACPTLTRSSVYNGRTVSIQAPTWNNATGARPSSSLIAAGEIQNPLTPQQSINCVIVPTGLKPQIVASELTPGPGDPLAYLMHFTFDERGRVWAVDTRDYPYVHNAFGGDSGNPPVGSGNARLTSGKSRIVILEDVNGDGSLDNFKVYHTGLSVPTSIEIVKNGVLVTVPPYIAYLPKSASNPDTAASVQIVVSGMGSTPSTYDTHGQINSLTRGLDNFMYGHLGYNNTSPTPTGRLRLANGDSLAGVATARGNIYRFKSLLIGSDTNLYQIHSASGPFNAHGIGQMEDGQWFKSGATGSSHSNHQVRHGVNLQNSILTGTPSSTTTSSGDGHVYYPVTDDAYYWEGSNTATRNGFRISTSTATSGHDFYTARLLPQKYWNRFSFVCDGSTKLCNQDSLVLNGSSWSGIRMPGPVRSNIFTATDAWVAPLKVRTGPDGALWVLDWYNYLFLHNPATPAINSAYVHPLRAKSRTRLYRLLPENGATEPVLDLSDATTEQLVSTLSNTNFVWRMHAQRLLIERGYTSTLGDLLDSILTNHRTVDAVGIDGPVIHALWTLHGLKRLQVDSARWNPKLKNLLLHPSWTVRRNVALALPRTAISATILKDQCAVNDIHAHVRVQAIQAHSEMPAPFVSAAQIVASYRNTDAHSQDAYTAAGTSKVVEITGTTRPGTCPAYLTENLGKRGIPSPGVRGSLQPRNDLRMQVVARGFDLLPHGQLESGEFILQDLRGRTAFRSVYNASLGAWSASSVRDLPHDVYFYSFRSTAGISYRGRVSLVDPY